MAEHLVDIVIGGLIGIAAISLVAACGSDGESFGGGR